MSLHTPALSDFFKAELSNLDTAQTSIRLVPTLIVVTQSPFHPRTAAALDFANASYQAWQAADLPMDLTVFLYGDAAMLANRLTWLPADLPNLAKDWQNFAKQTGITHQVCVSTALARGVTDADNAKRHGLTGDNLAPGFSLVGLGELAMHLHRCTLVKQF